MKQNILMLFVLVVLVSCSSLKKIQLMKSGEVSNSNFMERISFDYGAKLPIVEATINGHKGRFLFDTGAPNVLSKEFSQKLNLKKLAYGSVGDSGGNVLNNQAFIQIETITLGKVTFKNTGAIIQDLGTSQAMKCLNIDGIIGANLMRNAFWRIDYQNKKIEITDDLNRFELTNEYSTINFKTKTQGTPLIDLDIDGIKVKNLTFDTGSNGQMSIPTSALQALQKTKTVSSTYSIGSTTYGVGGKAKNDTLFYGIIDTIKIGNLNLEKKIIKFSTHSDNIGNKYFENYNVVLDWKNEKIYMKELQNYQHDFLIDFGFGIDWQDNGIYIGSIYTNSDATNNLQIGDKILKINNQEFTNLSNDTICTTFKNNDWDYEKQDSIIITVMRNDKTHEFKLNKKQLLPVAISD